MTYINIPAPDSPRDPGTTQVRDVAPWPAFESTQLPPMQALIVTPPIRLPRFGGGLNDSSDTWFLAASASFFALSAVASAASARACWDGLKNGKRSTTPIVALWRWNVLKNSS